VNIGKLNKKLRLQVNVPIKDTGGGYVDNWVDVADVWANRKEAGAREIFVAQQAGYTVTHVITIRAREIKKNMRFVEGDRFYYVQTVQEADDKGRFLKIQCAEGPIENEEFI
jgi:SPP1 family predicted phage head-tail adaptor